MKYKIKFEIDVPDDVPQSDVIDWVRFELGEIGSLTRDNKMSNFDLQSLPCLVEYAWESGMRDRAKDES